MTEQTVRLTVSPEQEGLRVDVLVSDAVEELTRSGVQKLLSEEHVSIDGKPVGKSRKVKAGEVVEVDIPAPQAIVAEAQDIPLTIVYEDADLLVVDKPKGMVVHPAPGNPDGTLVNALLWHCGDSLSGINGELRPGIVHRIDKDTSGLLVVAKNDMAHAALQKQIQDHSFTREYRAVVHGNFREDSGTIDAPIGRNPKDRKKMAVTTQHSRNAVTHWEVLERFRDYTYIKCRLETGRTHQIRVHMAYQGHPVAGDPVYGPANTPKSLQGQCLHAGLIGFTHPRT
ncbi:MAG: RluA family pseudouridine synthase [Clostridia bacterium]|nr:RluA family pseudouridine synthase [Clostridia bacterium]